MLEMTPQPERQPKFSCCRANQKQVKSKNLYIIFFGEDVIHSLILGNTSWEYI